MASQKTIYRTRKIALCALFVALVAVGAFMRVPIPVVPFTFQCTFTMLAGMLLGKKLGTTSVAIYVAAGLAGIPIFTQGGGITYVLQPTFGYLIGFIIGTFVTGWIARAVPNPSFKRLVLAGLAGLAIIYVLGTIYCGLITRYYLGKAVDVGKLILSCMVLVAPGDLALLVLGCFVAKRLIPICDRICGISAMCASASEESDEEHVNSDTEI